MCKELLAAYALGVVSLPIGYALFVLIAIVWDNWRWKNEK